MAFGFPAYHEERIRYDCSRNDLMDAALTAVKELGWGGYESGRWRISASTGISFWSWGETITAYVDPGPELQIRSHCAFPTQCIDWGRNAANVRRFLDRLDDVLADYARQDRRKPRDEDEPEKPSSSSPPSSRRPQPGSSDDSIRR